jgi:tetratricopeptide (TPR) repeat protein
MDAFLANPPLPMVVISGPAGVGKSTLAVHWAHRVAERFPDGQLFVNLGGFGPPDAMVDPGTAVGSFLRAMAIPAHQIPTDLAEQAALYRSVLARRRMLVVLDNARDAAHVRPLIPAAAGCVVIVTSRSQLTSLVVAEGAHPIPLDLFTVGESRAALTRRLGRQRVETEPAAVEELIERCARLPLALAVVAGRAAIQPTFPLSGFVEQLRHTNSRLDALHGGDAISDARTVFSWSYEPLSPEAARSFRLFGLHAGPDLSIPAAGSLAAVGLDRVQALLSELTGAGLITEARIGRHAMHDLVHGYAAELVHQRDTDEDRRAALHRLFDHYLHTAVAADLLLVPYRARIPLAPAVAGSLRTELAEHAQAVAWFTTEIDVLLAAVRHAAELGFDAHAWQLASALYAFLAQHRRWHEALSVQRCGLQAAQRLGDRFAQAHSRYQLGRAHCDLTQFAEARCQLRLADAGYAELHDLAGQAAVQLALGVTFEREGRFEEAMPHGRHALALGSSAGNTFLQARALNGIGWQYAHLGDHTQARTYCEQALILFEEIGDRSGAADTWDSIGFALHRLGQYADAAESYRHAIQLYRDLDHQVFVAITLIHLEQTHAAAGHRERARAVRREVAKIIEALDRPGAEQVALLGRLDQCADDGQRSAQVG